MSGEWSVTGGGTGLQAKYDDMLSAAHLIRSTGSALQSTAAGVAPIAVHPALAEAAVLCPGEVAEIEAAILRVTAGPHGLETTALALDALGLTITTGVGLYQAADATLADLAEKTQDAAALATLGGTLFLLANPQLAHTLGAHIDATTIQTSLYDNPWLLDAGTRMLPGGVQALTYGVSLAVPFGPLLLIGATRGNWPTTDYNHAVTGLQALLGHGGILQDTGTFTSRASTQQVKSQYLNTSVDQFLTNLAERENQVAYSDPPKVEVVPVRRNGEIVSYVVQIPGTDPKSGLSHGKSPYDWTTDVQEMTGARSRVRKAVVDALEQADLHGKPVMLAGHSLGGMLAADMAADPSIRKKLNIQSVVTYGSPVARYHIPDNVSVLSVEHNQDLVPKLDGRPNPDRANWTTITTDDPRNGASVLDAHKSDSRGYLGTLSRMDSGSGVPQEVMSGVSAWKDSNATFLGDKASGPLTHKVYELDYQR